MHYCLSAWVIDNSQENENCALADKLELTRENRELYSRVILESTSSAKQNSFNNVTTRQSSTLCDLCLCLWRKSGKPRAQKHHEEVHSIYCFSISRRKQWKQFNTQILEFLIELQTVYWILAASKGWIKQTYRKIMHTQYTQNHIAGNDLVQIE